MRVRGARKAAARSDIPEGWRSEVSAGDPLKASAPGIEIARPAAAPRTTVRIFLDFIPYTGLVLPWMSGRT